MAPSTRPEKSFFIADLMLNSQTLRKLTDIFTNVSQLRFKQQRFLLLLFISGCENSLICSVKAEALKLFIMFSLQP